MSSISTQAEQAGREAHQSEWLDHAARIGLIAYGLVHLVVAWLAVQLALGDKEGSADSQGAIQQLNEQPFGQALVWAVAIGMFLLALWQGLEALFGYRDEEGFTQVRKRVTAAGKAVVYVVIGVSAVRSATGSTQSKKNGTDSTTAKVMDWPGGQVIVCAVGLAIIGIGAYLVFRAYTEKFAKHINAEGKSGETGTAYLMVRQGRLHREGRHLRHRRLALPVRRADPRGQEVGRPRPGPAQGAAAAVRPVPPGAHRARTGVLRAVLLRPRPALQRLTRVR